MCGVLNVKRHPTVAHKAHSLSILRQPTHRRTKPEKLKMLSMFRRSKPGKTAIKRSTSTTGTGIKQHEQGFAWGSCSADGGWGGAVTCGKDAGYVCLFFDFWSQVCKFARLWY